MSLDGIYQLDAAAMNHYCGDAISEISYHKNKILFELELNNIDNNTKMSADTVVIFSEIYASRQVNVLDMYQTKLFVVELECLDKRFSWMMNGCNNEDFLTHKMMDDMFEKYKNELNKDISISANKSISTLGKNVVRFIDSIKADPDNKYITVAGGLLDMVIKKVSHILRYLDLGWHILRCYKSKVMASENWLTKSYAYLAVDLTDRMLPNKDEGLPVSIAI